MEELTDQLLELWRRLRRASRAHVRAHGLGPEQYWLLTALRRDGPLPVGELAARVGVTSSSMTTNCKRLEHLGLVSRQRRSDDQRVVDIVLSDRGAAAVDEWKRARRETVTALVARLDEGERDALGALLTRMLDDGERLG